MNRRAPQLASLAMVLMCGLVSTPAIAAGSVSPLPSSDYAVTSACSAPGPRHAACLALQLVPLTAAAREYSHPIGMVRAASSGTPARSPAAGDFGLRPQDLHSAYSLPNTPETEQTVALVDAYNDPTAEADLKNYDEEFGLPECTTANGCFEKVGQSGSPSSLPFPKTSLELEQAGESEEAEDAIGWGAEISLDIESAHATCEGCHILLVEADSTSYANLEAAETTAIHLGAQEVSNSWGGPEQGVSVHGEETGPFDTPGVVITASGGDNGFLGWDAEHAEERGFTNYPAASPHVVAVGGTRLTLGAGGAWGGESVWNGDGASGGGCSVQFTAPAWQQQAADWSSVGCTNKRAVADVAADADPNTGLAITDSSPACETKYTEKSVVHTVHWCTYGGTSLASPIIAAVYALAGGANGVSYPAKTLYESERLAPGTLHDVTSGSNGKCSSAPTKSGLSSCEASQEATASCSGHLSCLAAAGYDGPTGVGTPDGILGFQPGQEEETTPPEETTPHEEPAASPGQPPSTPVKQAPPTLVSPAPAPSLPGPVPVAVAPPLRVSGLSLTNSALIALNHHHPRTSAVGFAFTSNTVGRVHVSLSRRVRVHGHTRWGGLPGSASLTVFGGRNSGHLNGRSGLPAGLYRLAVTASGGTGAQLVFHIG